MTIIDFVNDLITKIPYVEKIPFAAILVPAVVAIVSIIFANYGKRLLNILKFVVCAGAGYYLGAVVLWKYVGAFLGGYGIPNIALGVVLALIVAVIGKYAYALVFAGVLGYGAYAVLTNASVVGFASTILNPTLVATASKYALVVAVAVGVLALFFRSFLETLITALLGGAGFSVGLYTAIVAITDALNLGANGTGIKLDGTTDVLGPLSFEAVVLVVVGLLVFLGGFLKQVKNRHRF